MTDVVDVPSCDEWVKTLVWVEPGDTLDFRASGIWVDAIIPCSADGYPAALFYAAGHPPRIDDDGRYFRLMGRIVPDGKEPAHDDPAQTFPIGTKSQCTVAQAGRLFVFANDRPGYYWNNWGYVTLAVSWLR